MKIGETIKIIKIRDKCPFCLETKIIDKKWACGFKGHWGLWEDNKTEINITVDSICTNFVNSNYKEQQIPQETKKCICDFDKLLTYGCKCGGV